MRTSVPVALLICREGEFRCKTPGASLPKQALGWVAGNAGGLVYDPFSSCCGFTRHKLCVSASLVPERSRDTGMFAALAFRYVLPLELSARWRLASARVSVRHRPLHPVGTAVVVDRVRVVRTWLQWQPGKFP